MCEKYWEPTTTATAPLQLQPYCSSRYLGHNVHEGVQLWKVGPELCIVALVQHLKLTVNQRHSCVAVTYVPRLLCTGEGYTYEGYTEEGYSRGLYIVLCMFCTVYVITDLPCTHKP